MKYTEYLTEYLEKNEYEVSSEAGDFDTIEFNLTEEELDLVNKAVKVLYEITSFSSIRIPIDSVRVFSKKSGETMVSSFDALEVYKTFAVITSTEISTNEKYSYLL